MASTTDDFYRTLYFQDKHIFYRYIHCRWSSVGVIVEICEGLMSILIKIHWSDQNVTIRSGGYGGWGTTY